MCVTWARTSAHDDIIVRLVEIGIHSTAGGGTVVSRHTILLDTSGCHTHASLSLK